MKFHTNYQITKKKRHVFMTVYPVYAIIYNCIVKELLIKRDVDISQEPIQFLYPMLRKHNAPFHLYQIHDSFLGISREILKREVPNKITWEARYFLDGKGHLSVEEEYTYFRLFGFKGTPFLLWIFVTNRIFVSKLCRQYLYWSPFLRKSISVNLYRFLFQWSIFELKF